MDSTAAAEQAKADAFTTRGVDARSQAGQTTVDEHFQHGTIQEDVQRDGAVGRGADRRHRRGSIHLVVKAGMVTLDHNLMPSGLNC